MWNTSAIEIHRQAKLAQKERTSLSRFFFIYSYFEKLLSEKMCSRQSRKVIWDMFNTLFLTLWLSNLLLLLSFSTRRHTSMASPASSFKFLWKAVHSKPSTIPFGVVACTLSDDLSRNSCIYQQGTVGPTIVIYLCIKTTWVQRACIAFGLDANSDNREL